MNSDEIMDISDSSAVPAQYIWELPPISELLVTDLVIRFQQHRRGLSKVILFTIALKQTKDDWSIGTALQLTIEAAECDYEPAQALLHLLFEYLVVKIPEEIEQRKVDYLHKSVVSGSVLAAQKLRALDMRAYADARGRFHDQGGFNPHYVAIRDNIDGLPSQIHEDTRQSLAADGYELLHLFAMYASLETMKQYISANDDLDLNLMTSEGETAVYLSCLNGSLASTKELLKRGGDPSIRCTDAKITCLHWLFAFEDSEQYEAAHEMCKSGANIKRDLKRRSSFFSLPIHTSAGFSSPLGCRCAMSLCDCSLTCTRSRSTS